MDHWGAVVVATVSALRRVLVGYGVSDVAKVQHWYSCRIVFFYRTRHCEPGLAHIGYGSVLSKGVKLRCFRPPKTVLSIDGTTYLSYRAQEAAEVLTCGGTDKNRMKRRDSLVYDGRETNEDTGPLISIQYTFMKARNHQLLFVFRNSRRVFFRFSGEPCKIN